MNQSDKLEAKWDAMTEDQRLLAWAKAKLADAQHRDSFYRFRWENNVANFWYDAKITYAYGSGKR